MFVIHFDNVTEQYDIILKIDDGFNAFSHRGLGRYGDSINPDADIQEMKLLKRYLNSDGVVVFTIPIGPDTLEFNAHRIYGPVRLEMLLSGMKIRSYFPCIEKYKTLEEAFESKDSKWENHILFVIGR
eukprot:TRINITY_DN4597_c0_g1_i2.p2 TRINITY_DN4597_c0_g1~~TRINITY_DN4597_c0_g1_i2.p2  ORF type:complete len:128 (+),score=14.58 TRINITY_DN4597_c0_g1_i2:598-981(+)